MTVQPPEDRPPDEEPTEPITPEKSNRSGGARHRRPKRDFWIRLAKRILGGGRAPALRATVP